MLCILSPAKTLDLSPHRHPLPTPQPMLLQQASTLAALGKDLSIPRLRSLMKVSQPLAERTAEQFQAFSLPFTEDNTTPAVLTFAGEVYRGLDARSLSADELQEANARVAILSGLYGVLRALDAMQPYRLEMGTRLENPRGKNLYQFWGDRVTQQLNAMTEGHADRTIVNLASKEYSRVVKPAGLADGMLDVAFKERKGGQLKTVAVYAKRARGEMARFIVQQRLDAPSGMQGFTGMGYRFDADASEPSAWVFTR